jgi:hypothetical protein
MVSDYFSHFTTSMALGLGNPHDGSSVEEFCDSCTQSLEAYTK